MTFLISIAFVLFFSFFLGKQVRMHPAPFYLAAAGIAVATIALTWCNVSLPAAFFRWVWPIFSHGGLAGGFFVIVMLAGAFPNGSAPIKRLMPIRGQLSIIASILTLGHNIAYGKVYFTLLVTAPASLPVNQLLAAVCSILMLIIMLPLFITSFTAIRKRMKARQWKRLQRFAYLFYALLCCHILLLTVPNAARGDRTYLLTVFVYGTVFLSYAACRILKAYSARTKTAPSLPRRQMVSVSLCMAAALAFVLLLPARGSTASGSQTDSDAAGTYQDGIFSGSAMGMNAKITVNVTIQDGMIVDIAIDSSREDEPYFSDALSVIDDIIVSGSTEVDTVSGATYSSGGIIDAVKDALKKACQ